MIPMLFRFTRYPNCRRATLLSFILSNALVSFFVIFFSLQFILLLFGVKARNVPMEMVGALLIGSVAASWALKLLARHNRWVDRYYKHCMQNRKG